MLIPANIFQPLIDVFEAVLKFFHNTVGVPWGWSIVLLTVVIRAALLPLALRQFHSMQKLQRLQPQMKALQAKYKDDKQRQQQELMRFYKENEVNPLASCLPLAAQLPVFLSLFYMLRKDLRDNICPGVQSAFRHAHPNLGAGATTQCGVHHGAGFLFIGDLTNKAVGATLVVLIVLYVGTQLVSSLMMATPTMDKAQRQLMLAMPLLFVVFVLSFPAGVIVYWITTNSWTILQQYIVRRRLGPMGGPPAGGDDAPPDSANGSGGITGGGGLGALLRPRSSQPSPELAGVGGATGSRGVPPPPPRKKKKRSGRRR